MKRFLIIWCILFPVVLFAQHHSWNGKGLSPNAKTRCLNIFVNIIYDVHPDTNAFNNNAYWPRNTDTTSEGINNAAIPTYLLDWMDTVYMPGQLHGTCTRLYGESSFDSLQLTGDFIVVNLKESTVMNYGSFNNYNIRKAAFNLIRREGFNTIYGYNQITDYDFDGNNKFDYVNTLIRNITRQYGGINPGSGSSGFFTDSLSINGHIYKTEGGTLQCVGDGDFYANPTNIIIHEISHSLFGGNNFHTSGGNHRSSLDTMAFLNVQGGYGLMGAAGSSLVSCNGYERWRMHWKHPQSADYISAQDNTGHVSVNSDVSMEDGNTSFVLRDFVTYGDAIRIKLPYKDSENSSNQYIWLENHQIRNNKLDFLQYSNMYDCRPRGKAGIYVYYQIGRDILEGTTDDIWDNYHRDNLKTIPAEGFYDYVLENDTHNLECVSYDNHYYSLRRGKQNPFCGGQDQEVLFFPQEEDSILYLSRGKSMWRKTINEWNDDHLACIGDSLDTFIPPTKINMGTNPSTCNAITYHSTNSGINSGYIVPCTAKKNTQTTYLTGLSIEMLRGDKASIQVNIRWNDYDISNDTRWTGNIILKDTAILTTPYSITLAQNRTVALPHRDPETGLFAGRTQWTCDPGSYFRQDNSTHVFLTENSSLVFQSGSTYEQEETAIMCVQAGCTLHIQSGANMQFMGTLEIDSGAVAILNGTVRFGNAARLIVRPGGRLIVNGGILTSAGAGAMWQGIELVGNRTKHQELKYQGTVELKNGAVIENAITSIRTGIQGDNWYTTGGIIIATDAVFRNNQQAVEFLSYNDTISSTNIRDNCSVFARCMFTIDTNNLLAINGRQFYNHVTLWDVKNVKFLGCTYENKMHRGKLCEGKGIAAIDAGLSLTTYPFAYAINSGWTNFLPDTFIFTTFSNFATAIEMTTTGNQYAVKIDEVKFNNNEQAISVNGNNFVEIIRCEINQTNYKTQQTYQRKGIYLNTCTGYHIEENHFYDNQYLPSIQFNNSKYGIKIEHSGVSTNKIYRNNIAKMANGILVSGTNGNTIGGLYFSCNVFSNNDFDIRLMPSSIVSPQQGQLSKGADNIFTGTNNFNLYNGGGSLITYMYSSSNSTHNPSLIYQVLPTSQGVIANPCYSSILDLYPIRSDFDINELAEMVSLYQELDSIRISQLEMTDEGIYNTPSVSPEMITIKKEASDLYHEAIRHIMHDSLTNMVALSEWHSTASILADPYSLSETLYQMDETLDYTNFIIEDIAERKNYATFRKLKADCATLTLEKGINWYALSEEKIEELIHIAQLNTGRSSVMARGILCFFYGICDEDIEEELKTKNMVNHNGEKTIRNKTNNDNSNTRNKNKQEEQRKTNMELFPNPSTQIVTIRCSENQEHIYNVTFVNMQGIKVLSIKQPYHNTIDISKLPAGVYVVWVHDQSGKTYSTKLVKE